MSKMSKRSVDKTVFPIWRTIKIGKYKNAAGARSALEAAGCYVGSWVDLILGKITFFTVERNVDLVSLSVAELGFADRATVRDVYRRATELGLSLCPMEVWPALGEAYRDQPMDEWLSVSMDSVADSDGYLDEDFVGSVMHNEGGFSLSGCYDCVEAIWLANVRFVFMLDK